MSCYVWSSEITLQLKPPGGNNRVAAQLFGIFLTYFLRYHFSPTVELSKSRHFDMGNFSFCEWKFTNMWWKVIGTLKWTRCQFCCIKIEHVAADWFQQSEQLTLEKEITAHIFFFKLHSVNVYTFDTFLSFHILKILCLECCSVEKKTQQNCQHSRIWESESRQDFLNCLNWCFIAGV